ncbi:hypothetical protein [Clostridium sp. Marseille-P299]|uniref:hypothetical protein n=1 Tax=Clostridium sp. Marseille-P299 TaxID=1805477 RepID=UPI0008354749|nr:hypothetical protein [Clostridium sp. Marseille-P299]
MNVDEVFIYKKLCKYERECINGKNLNWDKFINLIDRLITEYADLDAIEEIYVYHLARHFSEPTELFPLRDLLLCENPLSCFLKENGIEFKEKEGNLEFYYNTKIITPQEILSKRHFHLLSRRLGYLDENDFCVNGFAFWPDIKETSDGYYDDLQRGPEVIENIGRFIGKDLWRKFKDNSKYYGVVFRVPIEKAIFDNKDGIGCKANKVRCFLKHAILTMYGYYNQCQSSGNNIMLRIKDDARVKVDHCILIDE